MAITKTYRDMSNYIEDAYIRIERIWGSKSEGWNCWVGVYNNESQAKSGAQAAIPFFSVNASYVEGENPFTALYTIIDALPQLAEVKEEANEVPVVQEEKPKKKRTKKSDDK